MGKGEALVGCVITKCNAPTISGGALACGVTHPTSVGKSALVGCVITKCNAPKISDGALGTSKSKNIPVFIVGWTSCPPSLCGGQDARPTRWNNLFLGNPLAYGVTHSKTCNDRLRPGGNNYV